MHTVSVDSTYFTCLSSRQHQFQLQHKDEPWQDVEGTKEPSIHSTTALCSTVKEPSTTKEW